MDLLEAAGFSKSNPYYVVKQGKVRWGGRVGASTWVCGWWCALQLWGGGAGTGAVAQGLGEGLARWRASQGWRDGSGGKEEGRTVWISTTRKVLWLWPGGCAAKGSAWFSMVYQPHRERRATAGMGCCTCLW